MFPQSRIDKFQLYIVGGMALHCSVCFPARAHHGNWSLLVYLIIVLVLSGDFSQLATILAAKAENIEHV